ncbi:hypothetical protein Hypma_003289 [Hypsizygus marmoreus]|uniref:Uncharacterized protein n=1 Tax=Hypsizygus marmoreus TaxID=39966 RepID=A0A369K7E0_HYPMA|nr:hypothetical protein Hypma_003289 [Hypsizygus marmoreus]
MFPLLLSSFDKLKPTSTHSPYEKEARLQTILTMKREIITARRIQVLLIHKQANRTLKVADRYRWPRQVVPDLCFACGQAYFVANKLTKGLWEFRIAVFGSKSHLPSLYGRARAWLQITKVISLHKRAITRTNYHPIIVATSTNALNILWKHAYHWGMYRTNVAAYFYVARSVALVGWLNSKSLRRQPRAYSTDEYYAQAVVDLERWGRIVKNDQWYQKLRDTIQTLYDRDCQRQMFNDYGEPDI